MGDGLFETLRAYGGRVFRLKQHMTRLRASAEFLRLRFDSDEMFLTNSLMEIMPDRAVDRRRIGRGAPGTLTRRLREWYGEQVARETG